MKASILILDDDRIIADLMKTTLSAAGYRVRHLDNADEAFQVLKQEAVDLLLLDVDLPGIQGFKVLEILKQDPKTAGLPVIMITVKGEEKNKVKGLEGGADDYLVKPFSPKELAARVGALLRRSRGGGKLANVLEAQDISMDFDRRLVTVKKKKVDLTPSEFELLGIFMRRPGQVLTYQILAESLSAGVKELTSENIYVHVNTLRKKLGSQAKAIETVFGIGYRFFED